MEKVTLIHKVLCGKASDAEKAELNAWVSSDIDHAEEFDDIKQLYEGSLDIGQRMTERDPTFYDGLLNIKHRIKALKRAREKSKIYKVTGMVTLLIVVGMIATVHLFNAGKFSKLNTEAPDAKDGIRIYDNLRFQDATLETIFHLLEDRYELVFDVDSDEILSCRFTGTFYRGITIDEVVRTLAQSENFDYRNPDFGTYALSGKGCAH